MPIESAFAMPIYIEDAWPDQFAEVRAEFETKKPLIDTHVGRTTVWDDNIESSFSNLRDFIEEFGLAKLDRHISFHVKRFRKELDASDFEIRRTQSWINYQGRHQYQNLHRHAHTLISGVFYLDTTGEDGSLLFHVPDSLMESFPVAKRTPRTAISFHVRPKNGRIVLFPSYAPHRVQPNETDHVRISCSFNYAFA
jgi:uncharacterized protein (TIGR02466 family)